MGNPLLDPERITEGLRARHPDWYGTPQRLTRSIEFADEDAAATFVNRLATRSDQIDHHPDVLLRWRWVDLALWTHTAGGVTELDLTLAEVVDEVAATLPLAEPS